MRKYSVNGTMTISVYTIVEADSPREAKIEAEGRTNAHPHFDSLAEDEEWIADELDGEPQVADVQEQ